MPIAVQVMVSMTADNKTMSISVDQEPVDLRNLLDEDDISWELVNSGVWNFVASGIVIKNHGNKFRDKGGSGAGKKHGWVRKNRDHQRYRYAISVTDGTTTLTWDPSILND